MLGRGRSIATVVAGLLALATLLAPAAQAGWLPPVDISEPGENVASPPQVALDSEGNATAVWSRWNGMDDVVESSFRPAGEGWGPPENLSEPELEGEFGAGAHDATSPQVVVDRNGYLTVTWERYAFPETIIESVGKAPGGSWTEPIEIAHLPMASDPEPWLAVDWEGNNTAVWKQGEVIMSSFRTFAGEWGEPIPLSPDESFTPQAAMDGRGDATAVWMHYDGSHYVVESAYRPEQGEWEEPTLVSQPGEEGGNPHVALDAKGDALVVWRGEDEGEERLRAAYRPVGGEWGKAVDVSAPGEQIQSPRAAVDPDGNAIAVWSGSHAEGGGWDLVHASFKPVGEGWEEPVVLSTEGGNGFPSDIVFDNSGNASVIWQRWDGTTNLIQAAYRPAGEEWEPAVDLSEEGKQGMDARVVLDAPGDATAADGDATAIWISASKVSCEAGKEEPCWSYVVQAAGYDPDGLPAVELEAPLEAVVGEEIEVATPTEGLYSPKIGFGDGEEVAGITAAHVYDAPGEYQLTATGAEELGYRVSAQSTIKILPEDSGEGPGPEGKKEGGPGDKGSLGSGGTSGPGSASSPTVPPAQGAAPPAEDACGPARAARANAAKALRRTKLKLGRVAPGSRAHRRLAAVKQRRAAVLQRAEARLEAAC
jgi:hypothetical protein